MHIIEQSLLDNLHCYADKAIYVAYSGGVDSQVLLFALSQLKQQQLISNQIIACHIHHGLSKNADSWQQFCQQQAAQLGAEFITARVDIDIESKSSLEALAREARYQSIQSLTPASSIILTGHHLDDQTETFLLALKRGAGVAGLSAMKSSTILFERQVIRPLLDVSRETIELYAASHELEFIDDESNIDEGFDRNFIRHSVLPVISERWPSFTKTVARTAHNCQQTQILLDDLASKDLETIELTNESLSVEPLLSLSKERFNNFVIYFLKHRFGTIPSSSQLVQIKQQMLSPVDRMPEIVLGDVGVRRFQQALYFTKRFQDVGDWQWLSHQDDAFADTHLITLPDSLGEVSIGLPVTPQNNAVIHQVRPPNSNQQVSIRFSHKNPKCQPENRAHSTSLKKVLKELNIAPWQRKRVPFLYYDEALVAVLGHFVCKEFKPDENSTKLTINYSFSQDSR